MMGTPFSTPWSPHMGICASSSCDTRSTPAPERFMTTYLVLLHLCSCELLRTFSQHSHKSLTGLLFHVSDIFTIMLGSRSSSCSHGGLMPLLLPLITGCAVNGAKRYHQPPRRTPLCLSFITTRRGLQPHSVKERGRSSPQRPHSSPPSVAAHPSSDVALVTTQKQLHARSSTRSSPTASS